MSNQASPFPSTWLSDGGEQRGVERHSLRLSDQRLLRLSLPLTQKPHAKAVLSIKEMSTLCRNVDNFCRYDTKDRRMKLKLTCWSINQCSVDGEKLNFLFFKCHEDDPGLKTPGTYMMYKSLISHNVHFKRYTHVNDNYLQQLLIAN